MNITQLLNSDKEVAYDLDGKSYKVKMCSPTAAEAESVRQKFYKLGSQVSKGNDTNPRLAEQFEDCMATAVKACFPPDSEEASLDLSVVKLWLLRIGGDKSDVVQYAMQVCGIRMNADDTEGANDTAFS